MFKNTNENETEEIVYTGEMESNIKQQKISNQGGLIIFRYANDKIAEYTSNDEEINHMDLLKKSGVSEDELKATITFDLTIKTESGKEYKSNLSFDMPVEGVVENGTAAKEITDLSNIIFKRTKN